MNDVYSPSKITNDLGCRIPQDLATVLKENRCASTPEDNGNLGEDDTYHPSSSALKVLAFENIFTFASIRVRIASTGQILGQDGMISVNQRLAKKKGN